MKKEIFMLVLRRGRGQSIVIGENAEIIIKILNDEMGVISVGVDAPKSVQVDRYEVYEKKRQSLDQSVQSNKTLTKP